MLTLMRTTVNIADEALDLAKRQARHQGAPLGEVISEAVLATYQEKPQSPESPSFDLPTSGAGGLQPGVDLDSRSGLEDLMGGVE